MKQRSQEIRKSQRAAFVIAASSFDLSLRPFFSLCAFAVKAFAKTVEQR